MRLTEAPRAAYIHVPFCAHRCGYCNFTVVAGRDDLIEAYLQAIGLELARMRRPATVDTLYFGGGTPTQLSTADFARLAHTVLDWHPVECDYEWTVEANPADVSPAMAEGLANLGVTRISLGAQSLRNEKLHLLERDHTAGQIPCAVQSARNAGLAVAVDLIFSSPGETLREWQADLDAVLTLEPDHVSTYGLTFERGTSFWSRQRRGELVALHEDLERAMYESAIERLTAAGFEHYEVSNFAKSGQRSRHNQVYWSGAGYYAAGPGAARYVYGLRETNHRSTTTYLRRVLAGQSPVAEREVLDPLARARELLVLGLRRLEGVDKKAFAERTGLELNELVAAPLKKLVRLGMLKETSSRVKLTREGLLVSDAIWPELL